MSCPKRHFTTPLLKPYRNILSKILIICDEYIVPPLTHIFRNIVTTSIYPDSWKLANITPVFKKGDKQQIKNYRPISLLTISGKLLEKKILKHQLISLNREFNRLVISV